MGDNVVYPVQFHARASSTSDSVSRVIPETPKSRARRERAAQCRDGMPRERQQLTADGLRARADATALVPPRASMTESDLSMDETIVCGLQTSQAFAFSKTTFGTGCGAIRVMPDPREVIFGRLEALRLELHETRPELGFDVQWRFAAAIGLHKTSWTQIKNYDRDLPLTAACRIKDNWDLSLDWIYYGKQADAARIMAKIGRGPVQTPAATPPKAKRPVKRKAG